MGQQFESRSETGAPTSELGDAAGRCSKFPARALAAKPTLEVQTRRGGNRVGIGLAGRPGRSLESAACGVLRRWGAPRALAKLIPRARAPSRLLQMGPEADGLLVGLTHGDPAVRSHGAWLTSTAPGASRPRAVCRTCGEVTSRDPIRHLTQGNLLLFRHNGRVQALNCCTTINMSRHMVEPAFVKPDTGDCNWQSMQVFVGAAACGMMSKFTLRNPIGESRMTEEASSTCENRTDVHPATLAQPFNLFNIISSASRGFRLVHVHARCVPLLRWIVVVDILQRRGKGNRRICGRHLTGRSPRLMQKRTATPQGGLQGTKPKSLEVPPALASEAILEVPTRSAPDRVGTSQIPFPVKLRARGMEHRPNPSPERPSRSNSGPVIDEPHHRYRLDIHVNYPPETQTKKRRS